MSLTRTIIAVLILTVTALATQVLSRSESIYPNRPFAQFPMSIDTWQGTRSNLDLNIYNILGVEDYVLSTYRNPRGKSVNLYVGFYQSQKEGDLIHSPKNCMPGAGWHILETTRESVQFKGEDGPSKVARLLLEKGRDRQVVLYWFQSRGRIIASEYMQKIWLVIDAITRQRTDGSFVRLIAPVTDNEVATLEMLNEFARQIKPHLDNFIPL